MKKEAVGLFFIVCYLLDSALRQTQRLSIQGITPAFRTRVSAAVT